MIYITVFFFHIAQPPDSGRGPSRCRSFTMTLGRTSLGVWSARRRDIPYNTQHWQEIDFHIPDGIRNSSSRKRAAADPRLTPGGRCDRRITVLTPVERQMTVWSFREFIQAECSIGHCIWHDDFLRQRFGFIVNTFCGLLQCYEMDFQAEPKTYILH